jgi:hypothetical protein
MTLYAIALFVHVLGAMLLFVLLALEGFTLRSGAAAARLNSVLGPVSLLAILIPGFYMASRLGWQPWTEVGFLSYVFIAVAGIYTGISVRRGGMSTRVATVSWLVRSGVAVGVLFDMTVKPDLAGSVGAVAVAVGIALAAAVPTVRIVKAS